MNDRHWTAPDILEAMGYDPAEVNDPETEWDEEIEALQEAVTASVWTAHSSEPLKDLMVAGGLGQRHDNEAIQWQRAFEHRIGLLTHRRAKRREWRQHRAAVASAISTALHQGSCVVPTQAIHEDCVGWTKHLDLDLRTTAFVVDGTTSPSDLYPLENWEPDPTQDLHHRILLEHGRRPKNPIGEAEDPFAGMLHTWGTVETRVIARYKSPLLDIREALGVDAPHHPLDMMARILTGNNPFATESTWGIHTHTPAPKFQVGDNEIELVWAAEDDEC